MTQLQAAKPSSGGFLSGLFGGGQSRGSDPIPGRTIWPPSGQRATAVCAANAAAKLCAAGSARGGGFMAGALQTAAGVAGGVVLGNMLTNMFSGSHPQEIVNIIEENRSLTLTRRRNCPPQTIRSVRTIISSSRITTPEL